MPSLGAGLMRGIAQLSHRGAQCWARHSWRIQEAIPAEGTKLQEGLVIGHVHRTHHKIT